MKVKNRMKLSVDLVMILLMVALMGLQITGDHLHELMGIALFVLFLFHCVLNRHWFGALFQPKKSADTILMLVVNLLLVVDMVVLAVSSVFLSRFVFSALGLNSGNIWKVLHIFTSYFGLILMGVHLGLNGESVLMRLSKWFRCKPSRFRTNFIRGLAAAVAVMGIVSSVQVGMGSRLMTLTQVTGATQQSEARELVKHQKGKLTGGGATFGKKNAGVPSGGRSQKQFAGSEKESVGSRATDLPLLYLHYSSIIGLYAVGTYYLLLLLRRRKRLGAAAQKRLGKGTDVG